MEYQLNKKMFKNRLLETGFRGVSDLAKKTGLHRNTLQNLLQGQPVFSTSFRRVANTLKVDPLDLILPASSSTKKEIEEIREIVGHLVKKDKNFAVILLGSRVHGTAKKYSDWDLGIFRYPEPLSGREFLKLKREVSDLSEDLVRMVDLVNLNEAPLWFLEGMGKEFRFLDGNSQTYTYFLGVIDGIQKEKVA